MQETLKLIPVVVLVFPDSTVLFVGTPKDPQEIQVRIDDWKRSNPDYPGCTLGAVEIRMPEHKYTELPAADDLPLARVWE